MNRKNYFDYIEEQLSILTNRIEARGKLNDLSLHIHCENFYRDFLNKLFNWNLKNLNNIAQQNVEGIDLIDDSKKIVVQVSSTCTKQKIESSLNKPILKNYQDYRFKFLCISKDATSLRDKDYKNPHKIAFTPANDIYDNNSILKLIFDLQTNKQKTIYEFMQSEMGSNLAELSKLPVASRSVSADSGIKNKNIIELLRNSIGQSMYGWKDYGNWANPRGTLEEEYLLDEHIRLYNNASYRSGGVSAIEGINELRSILHQTSTSIRLVGLSGVGKTRLLQALFDERIGNNSLLKSQVIYCDIGDSPNPDPRNIAEFLIANKTTAILAIDNCPPDLHRRLTALCATVNSSVSLITIEYDVRDDQPEETEVFYLESASIALIEKVICRRFSHVNPVDARTIAEFSGGNARIAIALANTIGKSEDLADLRDEDLFLRLFEQRNKTNTSLLKVAEACALVYSFDGQVEADELKLLGSLVRVDVDEMYGNISELIRRDLVQRRSRWRAVLPQAIANRMAKRAIENIPLSKICNMFEKESSPRLLTSFSRRLGYLHESDIAREISKRWLSENGLLRDVNNFNDIGIRLFTNIAPINQELTLSSIERMKTLEESNEFFSRQNKYYNEFVRIIISLAYDSDLFTRSAKLLCLFALTERPDENYNSIRHQLKSLFYMKLSGTHATAEQRLQIIAGLVESDIQEELELGLLLLDAALEAWHFSSYNRFEFGARPRNYGLLPKSHEDVKQWYKLFIEYTVSLIVSEHSAMSEVKELLANKFRGLWIKAFVYEELELATKQVSNKFAWREGWIAIRTTKKFDGENMDTAVLQRLDSLESMLKPKGLLEKAKLYALTYGNSLDLLDAVEEQDTSSDYIRLGEMTRSIGCDVAKNNKILKNLLPVILSKEGPRLFCLGQGLADGCSDIEKMWFDFCEQLFLLEESKRKYEVLRGFLSSISVKNNVALEKLLDESITNKLLASVYPCLQTSVEITVSGVERLKQSLRFGAAPIWQYGNLAYSNFHKTVTDSDLCGLFRLIASTQEGALLVIKILHSILYRRAEASEIIVSMGREVILKYQFSQKDNKGGSFDCQISELIKSCFAAESTFESAKFLCNNLATALVNNDIDLMGYHYTFKAMVESHPVAVINVFLEKEIESDYRWRLSEIKKFIIAHLDDKLILNWCEDSPETRYLLVATNMIPFRKNEEKDVLEWTPLALAFIARYPDPILILKEFSLALRPTSLDDSRADIMEPRLKLIIELKQHNNSDVANWALIEEKALVEEIKHDRQVERERKQEWDERFEY